MSKNNITVKNMSAIMTKAISHFDTLKTKKVVVPEWDNVVIYATPFTMAEKKSVWKYAKSDDDLEFMIRTLILKALDENGKPLFNIGDRMNLLNKVSSDVIMRVSNQLTDTKTVEEQEGNS